MGRASSAESEPCSRSYPCAACTAPRRCRHRRQGRPLRGSRLRHRARRRRGLTRIRSAVGPLRAVGCLAKQSELLCLLAGRGRLPSPLLGSGLDRLSPAFRYYATIRLLSSLCHVVLSFFTATARVSAAEAERSPRVRTRNLVPTPSPLRTPPNGYRASLPTASSPRGRAPHKRFTFRSVRHCTIGFHQTPPRGTSASRRLSASTTSALVSALALSVWGSLRQGPRRISFSSYRTSLITFHSAPMPGAPKPSVAALPQDFAA